MKTKAAKNWTDKLLSVPGIKEAIELVEDHALNRALDEALEAGAKGELGDELYRLLTDDSDNLGDNLDKFFRSEDVVSFVSEAQDSWLEALATEAGPKIAELWHLSPFGGERLAEMIYKLEGAAGDYFSPPIVVVKTEKPEVVQLLREKSLLGALISPPGVMQDGHIYIDVTYIPYDSLLHAYKVIALLRDCLGIRTEDLREGAPKSIDVDKALDCAYLASSGKCNKEIARELGFRIYRADNPSGSYPLFRKYLKLGLEIVHKLQTLNSFLDKVSF